MIRLLALAALLIPGALVASAQEPLDPGDGEATVTVNWGEYELEVPAIEPLSACVIERRITLDSTTDTLVVFVRNADGVRTEIGTFSTSATAALEDASVGDCLALGSE